MPKSDVNNLEEYTPSSGKHCQSQTELGNVEFTYQEWRIMSQSYNLKAQLVCEAGSIFRKTTSRGVPRSSPTWITGGAGLLKGSSRSLVGEVLSSWGKNGLEDQYCVLGVLLTSSHGTSPGGEVTSLQSNNQRIGELDFKYKSLWTPNTCFSPHTLRYLTELGIYCYLAYYPKSINNLKQQ